jgi:large subunit ribosomal protein L9
LRIILTQAVDRLGRPGDCINVKDGYARNFLFPKNLAKEATPGNIKSLESLKKKQALEDENRLKEARALAEKLAALSITINAKCGEEEKLFGAVTAEMISGALKAEGVSIDKKDIVIDEPIKKLGVYNIGAKIHPEVKASVKVWVVKE